MVSCPSCRRRFRSKRARNMHAAAVHRPLPSVSRWDYWERPYAGPTHDPYITVDETDRIWHLPEPRRK